MSKLIPLLILGTGSLLIGIMKSVIRNIGLSKNQRSMESGAEVFVWPGAWWFIVGITAFVISFGFIFVFSQWSLPGTHPALIFMGSMCGLFLFCLIVHTVRHLGYQATLDKHGIAEYRYGKLKVVAWPDIVRVQTSQMLNMRQVRIFGKDGTVLALEYELEGFSRLIEILLEHGWSL